MVLAVVIGSIWVALSLVLTFISFLLCRDCMFVYPKLKLIKVCVVEDKNWSQTLKVEPEQKLKGAPLLMLRWVCRRSRKLLLAVRVCFHETLFRFKFILH